MNSKYIILFSHVETRNGLGYINQFNIIYHNRQGWCKGVRFFTTKFIHKKPSDKLIANLLATPKENFGSYVNIGEWRVEKIEKCLTEEIKNNRMGHIIRRFEIKK